MPDEQAEPVTIEVDASHTVSGLLQLPRHAVACYVLAHGAGAGMTHSFINSAADGLAKRSIATLRYQFPFMQHGLKRPDRPAVAQATVRAAVSAAARLAPGLRLFAGGKSFGGRMTSEAQAVAPLTDVRGLVFLGFPLHPANKPSQRRAEHLPGVRIPLLFLQGTRDPLADLQLLAPIVRALGGQATLRPIDQADHAFHVPVRSGRTDAQVLDEVMDAVAAWIRHILST